jgi:hypothetical protein
MATEPWTVPECQCLNVLNRSSLVKRKARPRCRSFKFSRVTRLPVLAICLAFGVLSVRAQGSQFAVPCPSQTSGGVCTNNATDSSIIDAMDYYDLSIISVCVNYPDSFWQNKLISLQVTITAAGQAPRSIPIFNARAQSSCMIGVNGFALVNSVPFDGNNLTVETDMYRSDASDGLQKILSFASGTSQQSIFVNYAAAAVPFLTAATSSINSAITTFGQSQTPWLTGTGITFTSATPGQVLNSDLREEYMVQYQGPSNINNASFFVDGNDLRWNGNGTYVRDSQSAWVLYRIRKRESRINMASSAWYSAWIKALNGVEVGTVDGPALTKAMQAASAMLQNDLDYTNGDRDNLTSNIADAARQINAVLSSQSPDYAALRAAIKAAEEPEGAQSPAPQSADVAPPTVFLPVNAPPTDHTSGPAAVGAKPENTLIVTPQKLAEKLRALAVAPQ